MKFVKTKALILLALPMLALALASPANAGGRHHGGGYWSGGYYDHGRHGYRSGYRRGYRHGTRHYRHRRHRGNDGAYLIGGLVVGSLITHAIHSSRNDGYRSRNRTYNDGYYERRRSTTYDRGYNNRTVEDSRVSRRLFKDAQGNCFERVQRSGGQEDLIELSPSECNW